MPFIRLDEDGFELDDPDDELSGGHYTGPFNYHPAADFAYKPHPFDPADLTHVAAVIHAALVARGATRFRVTYDGGHDEGFARADAVWFGDGTTARPADAVAADFAADAPLLADLDAARRRHAEWVARYSHTREYAFDDQSPRQVVGTVLDDLAHRVAAALLGDGFGTGEYSMYGACVLDLRTNVVTDDPAEQMPDRIIA